jgi:hypothetical protein
MSNKAGRHEGTTSYELPATSTTGVWRIKMKKLPLEGIRVLDFGQM